MSCQEKQAKHGLFVTSDSMDTDSERCVSLGVKQHYRGHVPDQRPCCRTITDLSTLPYDIYLIRWYSFFKILLTTLTNFSEFKVCKLYRCQ